jgi:hypothetical protein
MIATLAQPPVTRSARVEAENQNLHQLRRSGQSFISHGSRVYHMNHAEVVIYWHDREGFYLDEG